jgi:hypothetical protein
MLKGECVGREADIKTLTDQLHAERARVMVLERSASMYLASPIVTNPEQSPASTYANEMALALEMAAPSVSPAAVGAVAGSLDKDTSPSCIHFGNNTAARASVSPALNSFGSRTMTSIEASPHPQLQSHVTVSGIQNSDRSSLSRNAAVASVGSAAWRPTSAAAGIPPVNVFGGHQDKRNAKAHMNSSEVAAGAEAHDDMACNDAVMLNQMLAEARGRIASLEKSVSRNQVGTCLQRNLNRSHAGYNNPLYTSP